MASALASAIDQAQAAQPATAQRAPGLWETAFYVFVTFYASKALFVVIAIGPANLQDNQVSDLDGGWLRMIWAFCYAGTVFLVWRNFEAVYRSLKGQKALCLLLAWSLATAVWSAEPMMTVQYTVIVALCALMGVLMGTRYSLDGVIAIISTALAIALVMSAIAIFLVPGWGKMPGIHAGAWSGIFIHKNGLGSAAVMGATIFGYNATRTTGQTRWAWLGLVAMSVMLTIGARSATALVVLTVIGVAAWLSGIVRLRRHDLWLAFFAILTAGFFCAWMLASNLELFFKALGKDMTLTGRIELWQWGFNSFLHRPIGGYGFETFWLNKGPYGGAHIRVLAGWAAPHIHNSWLQIALDTGIVGIAIYVSFLVQITRNAWQLAANTGEIVYRIVLLLLLQTGIYSMVETMLYKRNAATFIMLVALSVALVRESSIVKARERVDA